MFYFVVFSRKPECQVNYINGIYMNLEEARQRLREIQLSDIKLQNTEFVSFIKTFPYGACHIDI